MKFNNTDLNNKIKAFDRQLNDLKLALQNNQSNINMNNQIDLIRPIKPEEIIMGVIFNSQDFQDIEW